MISNIQADDDGNFMMIHMDQQDIIQTYLSTQDYNPILNIHSPMGNKYQLLSEPELLQGEDINIYQSIIGTLNYIACTTRYDISYPVARLAQFAARPTVGSIKAVKKVLSYLGATNDFKISGIMSPKLDRLEYYSDSDHAGDMPITTFSHTGTVILLNKVPIHWRSKKQPKTSRSSAEAEIYALSDTLADARLNNWRLRDIGINIDSLININVDNNQAKVFADNTCVNSKLRTAFSLKHAWVKELRDRDKVKVIQIPAAINVSDFLTKVQPGYKVTLYNKMINPYKIIPKDK
jgi:hypothetical protein